MNIWQILGIERTSDKSAIKKAFAEKSKKCHPEEHPEEFKLLKKAYQGAMRSAEDNDVPDNISIDGDTTFYTQSDNEQVTPDPEMNDDEELIDFSNMDLNESTNKDLADSFMANIRQNYVNRNWIEIFNSDDFNKLKTDRYFTNEFLDYILTNNKINITLLSYLKEWEKLWIGTDLVYYFDFIYNTRRKKIKKVIKQIVSGLFIGVVLICIFLGQQYRKYKSSEVDIPQVPDYSRTYLVNELPLTNEDYSKILSEQAARETVYQAVINSMDYTSVESEAVTIGLPQEEYNTLAESCSANADTTAISASLQEYGTVEAEIINEKMIPDIKSNIISASGFGNVFYLCYALGIESEQYEELVQVYNSEGELALDAVLSGYCALAHSVIDIQYDEVNSQ